MSQPNASYRQQIDDASRPKFSFGKQLRVPSPGLDEDKGNPKDKAAPTSDWVDEAHLDIRQDLVTSKKELGLITSLLEDLEKRFKTRGTPKANLVKQMMLMNACKDYTVSRCNLLDERLRQVGHWIRSKEMGSQVPRKAPEEWRLADIEWRTWLSDQASRSGIASALGTPTDPSKDVAWRVLGPVACILDVFAFVGDYDMNIPSRISGDHS
ncbi:hypothetical protein GGR57DRAFT_517325 [Xylariaceae sp. FL1272]|nr:hypothetical protein GGR57DRAFT_517325 [Xylariaceae sp. FL1272]